MMRDFKLKFFEQSAHAFTALKPRYAKETVSMQMHRVKRTKPKEPNDLKMVQDFLNGIDREPVDEVQLQEQQPEDRQFADESREDNFTSRRRKRADYTRPSTHDLSGPSTHDLSAECPLPCSET